MKYFYKDARDLFHVDGGVLPSGNFVLRTYKNTNIVSLEALDSPHEIKLAPIEITKLFREDDTAYPDLNTFLDEVGDFFVSGFADLTAIEVRVTALEDIQLKISIYEPITTVSGTVTIPSGGTIVLQEFLNGEDALICAIQNGQPTFQDTGYDITSFNIAGNYIASGLPSNPSALIYYVQISLKNIPNIPLDRLAEPDQLIKDLQFYNLDELLDVTYPTAPVENEVLQRNNTGLWINKMLGHNNTIDRDVNDCHPISAITGLTDQITTYIHNQLVPNTNWPITHNLGKFPSATIIDSSGQVVIGDVSYIDNNNINLTFTSSFSGKAYLN